MGEKIIKNDFSDFLADYGDSNQCNRRQEICVICAKD